MAIEAFAEQNCSLARSMSVLGERWTVLILRELFYGNRRFRGIQRELGLATNVLSERLATLVEAGIIQRQPYSERRLEYRLTEKGLELQPVLLALLRWGDRFMRPGAKPRQVVHLDCGHVCEQVPVCSQCGGELHARNTRTRPGPGATRDAREAQAAA